MDWEFIKQMAFGPLNLTHGQLGRLTYSEFSELLTGYQWRERRKLEEFSILAAWVSQPHVTKPVSPEDFLPSEKKKSKKHNKTKEEIAAEQRELEKRLGVI